MLPIAAFVVVTLLAFILLWIVCRPVPLAGARDCATAKDCAVCKDFDNHFGPVTVNVKTTVDVRVNVYFETDVKEEAENTQQ